MAPARAANGTVTLSLVAFARLRQANDDFEMVGVKFFNFGDAWGVISDYWLDISSELGF